MLKQSFSEGGSIHNKILWEGSFDLSKGSGAIELGISRPMAIQIWWAILTAGSPTVDVEVSNNAENWESIAGGPQAMAVGGGNLLVIEPNTPYKYMRIVTVPDTSTGTYNVKISQK